MPAARRDWMSSPHLFSRVLSLSGMREALDAGAQALKIFPSSAFGPDYIKALKAVLPASVPVFAVGGVTPDNLAQWMKAGCVGAGLGSDLYRAGQSVARTAQQDRKSVV